MVNCVCRMSYLTANNMKESSSGNLSKTDRLLAESAEFEHHNVTGSGQSLFKFSKWSLRDSNQDALQFGVRMLVCLTVSSLFVLAQTPTDEGRFPEGMWVVITVLFICWFPTLDAASMLEKSVQRLIVTMIGTSL